MRVPATATAGTRSVAMDDKHPVTGVLAMQHNKLTTLYLRAFSEFGMSALWSSRPVCAPTPADALAITRSLRTEGNLQARQLAEEIEAACRAAV